MHIRSLFLGAAAICAILSTPATAYEAESRVEVTPVGTQLFSVPSGGPYGARGAWCAAADYAINVLGAAGTTRLYVREPKTTPSGPVVFGFTPGDTQTRATVSIGAALRSAGSNLAVDHAFQFCHDLRLSRSR